jgi:glycosyltransferase involved in cell wall biosynthesis
VTWGKLDRFELRELYARSAIAVVPIKQNKYQTGIATILEMMAMGKCIVATKTEGQTDTIVDGVTGIYVPPADPRALREAIENLLANPSRVREIGQAARRFIEKEAGLDVFVERMKLAVMSGHAAHFPG